MSVKCAVTIIKEDDWYVATDALSGVASQGKTIDESIENLKEAIALYYEDASESMIAQTPVLVAAMEFMI